VSCALVLLAVPAWSADKDSPLVAAARKKLATKVSVEFKETPLREVKSELEEQVEGLKFRFDVGVSGNQTLTYKGKDEPLSKVLDGLFKGKGLGYVIHRKKSDSDRYEGWIDIVQGDQRGDELPPKK
jgi:hypothetical protein